MMFFLLHKKAGNSSASCKTGATGTPQGRENGIKASYTRLDGQRSIYNAQHNLHTEINAGQIHTKYMNRQMDGCSRLPVSVFTRSVSIQIESKHANFSDSA